ncbi:MAG: formate dehydrogenase subunit gamma [Anaerolineae bacterium]
MTLIKDRNLEEHDTPVEAVTIKHPQAEAAGPATEPPIAIEAIRQQARIRKLRAARDLAARLQVMPDGARQFIRFNHSERREHQILIITFFTLAVTGLLQHYSQLFLVTLVIDLFGGMETLRVFHHLAAIVLIIQSVYHAGVILNLWAIKRQKGSMWPSLKDLTDLIQMLKFNLGFTNSRPEFDRFSIEEKLEYWALLWGTPLMIITGLIMWFPIPVTRLLPGDTVPVSQALHAWEAILATLAILTWHMYHTVIKERNRTIFTGLMSEETMRHEHPLEYRRIIAAHDYLQKMVGNNKAAQQISQTEARAAAANQTTGGLQS